MDTNRQPISGSIYANKRRRCNKATIAPKTCQSITVSAPARVKAPTINLPIPNPALPIISKPIPSIESLLAGQLSPETKRAYRSDLRHFLGYTGFKATPGGDAAILDALQRVTRTQAAEYRDTMIQVDEYAAATVNRRLSNISNLYELLKEEGIVGKNPFSRVKRPKLGREGKTPALTQEQAERILSQPNRDTLMGRRDRVLLLLLFFCGLRRGEVVRIEVGDFYEDRGHILLNVYGKGRSGKVDAVKVPPRIWPEIRDYLSEKGEGLLFTGASRNGAYNRKEKPISPMRVYLLFQKYCHMAGVDPEKYSPHSTRATFITLCLAGGADVRSVMYAARHSDPATTIRYDRARMNLDNHASQFLKIESPAIP